jgi:polysaccharide biosynthesis PFTS motif protein
MDEVFDYLNKNFFINFFFRKKRFRFLLNSKRNYNKIIKKKELIKIREIFDQIIKVKTAEKTYNQSFEAFIINKLIFTKIFRITFFYFIDKKNSFFFPLPKEYLLEINKYLRVNFFFSRFLWFILNFFFFFKFLISIFKIIYLKFYYKKKIDNITNFSQKKIINILNNFPIEANFNKEEFVNKQDGLFQWLKNQTKEEMFTVFTSKNINQEVIFKDYAFLKDAFIIFITKTSILKILICYLLVLLSFTKNIFLKRFNYPVLALEVFKSKIVNNYKKRINFYEIWSNTVYQPLWIKSLEDQNLSPYLIFNNLIEEMKSSYEKVVKTDIDAFSKMNWNNYFVWNDSSKNFLESHFVVHKTIIVTNFFLNNNSPFKIFNQNKEKSVSAFIYEDHKSAFGISTIADYMQYNKIKFRENVEHQFVLDLLELSKIFNFRILLKRKRNIPKEIQFKKNENFYEKLKFNDNLIIVDAKFCPSQLILNSKINISLPFTSTGFLGKKYNSLSLFYDPYNWVLENDPSNAGVLTLKGKKNLNDWLSKNF